MIQKDVSIFDFGILDFSLGRKYGLLSRLYFSILSQRLKHLGIEKNFSILVLIDKMGNQCSQKFIADTLHIDKTMMVGVLDILVERGFIRRTQNPSDRRQYWIQLTAKGRAQMPEIKEVVKQLNEAILEGITPSDKTKLNKQLQMIYKNIQTISQS